MKWSIKSHFLLLFVLVVGMSVQSQELFLWQRDTTFQTWNSVLFFNAGAEHGSNYLDNYFVDRLAFGGKLQAENIEEAAQDMNGAGRLGGYALADLEYFVMSDSAFGNPDYGFTAALGERADAYSYLSEDAFRLGFQGNARFAGQTADLTHLNTQAYSWTKLGFGVFHKKNWSFLRVNLLAGNAMAWTRGTGQLFTSEAGDSLHLNFRARGQFNAGAPRGTAGLGAGIDGALRFPLENNTGYVSLALRDLGFIVWNKNTERYLAQSEGISFTGLELGNILENDVNTFNLPTFADSLTVDSAVGTSLLWLAPTIDFRWWKQINEEHFYRVGISTRPLQGYRPELSASYIHQLNPNVYLNVDARVGGYRGFRLGAGIETLFSGPRTWYGGIQVSDVPGWFFDSQKGRAVWFSIGHIFTNKKQK